MSLVGFPNTENWLQRNRLLDSNGVEPTPEQTIWNAYLELMDWPENSEFPEVLAIDKERIMKLSWRAKRLCVSAAFISICTAIPIISERSENRIEMASQIFVLLQNVNTES